MGGSVVLRLRESPAVIQLALIHKVGKLVDQICMNLPLDYVNRQKLLEAVELSERYDTLCVMIANEIQIQEIRSEIQGKIKERIDKNQRDYILREQLKVIREELGEDNSRTEIENYKKQLEKLKASKEVKERISEEIHRLENSANNPSFTKLPLCLKRADSPRLSAPSLV